VLILSQTTAHFTIWQIWFFSAFSVFVQAVANVFLVKREFERKLIFPPIEENSEVIATQANS
jgi:isopentenyldiphosphate isomerase